MECPPGLLNCPGHIPATPSPYLWTWEAILQGTPKCPTNNWQEVHHFVLCPLVKETDVKLTFIPLANANEPWDVHTMARGRIHAPSQMSLLHLLYYHSMELGIYRLGELVGYRLDNSYILCISHCTLSFVYLMGYSKIQFSFDLFKGCNLGWCMHNI